MRTRRPGWRADGKRGGGAIHATKRRRGEITGNRVGRPRVHNGIACASCGAEIIGCAETKYGGGWVHDRTNREACADQDEIARPL